MPHFMSNMAESQKITAQRKRKASALRKGSPTLGSSKGAILCGSPPSRVFYRQDFIIDTQTYTSASVDAQLLENGVEFPRDCAYASSPPVVSGSKKTKSGGGIRHAPSPAFLPQPPKHWVGLTDDEEDQVLDVCFDAVEGVGSAISNQLKMLLKVQG